MTRIAFALAVLASMGWVTQVDSEDPLFVPASPLMVGPGSGEVALADINRDGHLDIVTKHLLRRVVNVRLGDGSGHFALLADGSMNFGYEPGAIALGDVNEDSILDLAVASKDDSGEYVRLFLGNGKGGFSSAAGPHVTTAPFKFYKPSLRLVDINEDGKVDIVTANGRRNSIEILLGDGRGAFSPGPIVKLEPGQDFYSFAVGDVDEDGHLDVVTAGGGAHGGPGRFVVKGGDGRGTFSDSAASPSIPPAPRVATLADVNGDQHLDIVLSHSDRGLLSVLLNAGNGAFVPAADSPYNIGTEAFAVVVADVNGDKRADILLATVNSVTVLLGDGRAFVAAHGSPFRAGPGAYNLAVGDVNEDGKLDVAASSFGGDSVTVLLGR